MNLPSIVHLNIQSSPYFKDLYRIKTYHEVLDEIYAKVEYLGRYFTNFTIISALIINK